MESQYTVSSIIIIVWLIFPGVVFKRFYYQGQFTKQFGAGLFADRLITSLFWGIFVQIVTFVIYSRFLNFTFTGIEKQVHDFYKELSENKLPLITYKTLYYILGYLMFLVVGAAILGTIIHKTIRFFRIDIYIPVFRFANHWHYYFTGEILKTKEFKALKTGKWDTTIVDVVIDDGSEDPKMIKGYLSQYTISHKTGDLESIYLTNTQRYSKTQQKFINVPGDCFIVLYEKVVDMNITYNQIKPNGNIKRILRAGVNFLGYIILIFSIVYPWYLDVRVVNKLVGTICEFVTLLFTLALLSFLIDPSSNPKMTKKAFWTSLVISVTFLFFTLLLFQLISFSK